MSQSTIKYLFVIYTLIVSCLVHIVFYLNVATIFFCLADIPYEVLTVSTLVYIRRLLENYIVGIFYKVINSRKPLLCQNCNT